MLGGCKKALGDNNRRMNASYRTQSADTDLMIEHLHINALREAGPRKRSVMALMMTTNAVLLSRRALRRQNSDLTEAELGLKWISIHYGKALADKMYAQHQARPAP